MLRRHFLRALLGALGFSAAQTIIAKNQPVASLLAKNILLQSSRVAGFQYYLGETIWASLAEGSMLALIREPENPHDNCAIRLDWNVQRLGYIPRVENYAAACLPDQGIKVEARIIRLAEHPDPWERIKVELYLNV